MTPEAQALVDLAERCEAATAPDRDLDALIAPVRDLRAVDEGHPLGWQCYNADGRAVPFPRYTASLDAAMSLVPEGWGWLVSQPNAKAIASGLLKDRTPVMGEVQNGCDQRHAVACATPALALTAASLRALASFKKLERVDGVGR